MNRQICTVRKLREDSQKLRITKEQKNTCRLAGVFLLVQDVQDQGQNDECCADPLGSLSKLSVEALSIAAGEESVCAAAADAVRQAGVLAGLEQNCQNDSQTAQKLKNRNESNEHDL